MKERVLIVDDDDDIRQAVDQVLADLGYRTLACASAESALQALAREDFDAIVTDVRMPCMDGIQLCEHVVQNHPDIPVLVMTAYGNVSTVVGAMRAAAVDFLRKPFTTAELSDVLQNALARRPSRRELTRIEAEPPPVEMPELIGSSSVMLNLKERIRRFARSGSTVLVTGESGTGKELVARALHRYGSRPDGPFIAINCAALPAGTLASELFGHARGAFTDANATHHGLFLAAHGGTLFLDEIGAMPLELQPVLLRALEERVVRPVGGSGEHVFNTRIVAATNSPLQSAVRNGTFREDLLFRLSVLKIHAPPLRERGDDVLELAEVFLQRLANQAGTESPRLLPDAVAALQHRPWPGNVRELENCMEAAFTFSVDGRVRGNDIPKSARTGPELPSASAESGEHSLELVERLHIERALQASDYNKAEAARRLGIDRTTLYRKMKRLGLEPVRLPRAQGH